MRTVLLALLLGPLLAQPARAAPPDVDDVLLHSVGEFQLEGSAPTRVMSHAVARPVRVCVRESLALPSVPIRVRHDGTTDVVPPGSCLDLVARRVRLSAAEAPPPRVALIGRMVPPHA